MPAGKRRFLITIQKATEAEDASGQPMQTWVTYCQARADVEQTGGTERFRGRSIQAYMTHVIELRANPTTRGITPAMRVIWMGRTIALKVVRPLNGELREIELQGVEVVNP